MKGPRAPRARLVAACAALMAASLLTGCIGFLDPNLPPATPALMQLGVHFLPTGQASFDAHLEPGRALSHEFRTVPDDTLLVNGKGFAPTTVHVDQARDYAGTVALPAPVGPITIATPAVAGIPEVPPTVQWFGIRKLDPDTIVLPSGADLHLHVDPTLRSGIPVPSGLQWFLQLFAGGHVIQIGSDGLPPADLHVPVEFVPADSLGTITASLLLLYSGQLFAADGNYVVNAQFDQHLTWTVLRPGKGTP